MADTEEDRVREKESCEQESSLDMINGRQSPNFTEERIRVDRRKLEILLQGYLIISSLNSTLYLVDIILWRKQVTYHHIVSMLKLVQLILVISESLQAFHFF